jgi:alginate O-acetyltransferase complex protein AlgI
MQFTAPAFALFVLLLLPAWHGLSAQPRARALLSMVASGLFFYYASMASFLCAASYATGAALLVPRFAKSSRTTLGALITILLLPLLYFKYSQWLFELFNFPLDYSWPYSSPLGLSFYTFSTIAWLFYLRSLLDRPGIATSMTLSSIFFFPLASSGPVVRPNDCAHQLADRLPAPNFGAAASVFTLGFILKLVISTRLGALADGIFNNPNDHGFNSIFFAIHAYSGQLYADFAGYSLMAIGVAKIFGVDIPENFNAPYFSSSISEFWRRWHISLSTFWRERIYFPLGGSRLGKKRELINLTLVMILCGIWHGAGFSFLFWGFLHGAMLCLHRIATWLSLWRLPKFLAIMLTFECVTWAWLPFRLSNWADLSQVLEALSHQSSIELQWGLLCLCFLMISCEHLYRNRLQVIAQKLAIQSPVLFAAVILFLCLVAIELAPPGIPPFIYAGF